MTARLSSQGKWRGVKYLKRHHKYVDLKTRNVVPDAWNARDGCILIFDTVSEISKQCTKYVSVVFEIN